MINLRRKKTILAFSAMVIFLSVGCVYAFVKTQTKSKNNLIKQADATNIKEEDASVLASADVVTALVAADNSSLSSQIVPVAQAASAATVVASLAPSAQDNKYPVHHNISTTYFWVGEEADADNKNISNSPSAWDEQWAQHFGGVDDPKKRNGFVVAKFAPKENSFYFALPYNDFDENGDRKKDVNSVIPWASSKKWGATESICKNQWIKITRGGKVAYAQWEDVGPFKEDDQAYVFGTANPKSKTNDNAGLDVSPAVHDFLGLGDVDKTDWQFIDASQVPDGPWKTTTTTSQINWS